jgi:hypothetical protein
MVVLTHPPRVSCRYCGDPWPGATPWVCRCGQGSVTKMAREAGGAGFWLMLVVCALLPWFLAWVL